MIEKHFTLDKNAPGPDHSASVDPVDLKTLIRSLRDVEASLGDGRKKPTDMEEESRFFSRRSIVAAVDIRAQEPIAGWMLTFKRPASGIEPRHWEKIIGTTARRNLSRDTILQWEDLAPSMSFDTHYESSNPEQGRASERVHPLKKQHA